MNDFTIETNRLRIRKLEGKDKEAFFHYRSMPEVFLYQLWKPESMKEIEEFISRNNEIEPNTIDKWLQLSISLKEGPMIGDIGVHFIDQDQIELGYTVSPEYQGKGYAIEAVTGVMNFAFTLWNKHRITASVDPDNLSSVKLLERIGFRKEAHFVKSFRVEDQWYDDCIYAMLKDEWIIRLSANK